ncbi:accessory gene regulator B family protein [Ferviditalea candida]|uniref:Accessory gene regulator B family protein n=1 Tax=Ferviditalea candida TaxID=3108399 RepID=A0ABU5ZEK9_9BACL|nr:accessory gene regulator B family protein [Paenibacillaceae bacterium T2]
MQVMDKVADQIARYVHKNAENPSSKAVLKYAVLNIMDTIIVFAVVLAICLATGHFWNGLVAVTAFPILRNYSGGMHLYSPRACNVLSAFFVIAAAHVSFPFWFVGLSLNLVSLVLVLIYAPANIRGYSRADESAYRKAKIIAALIVSANFLIQSPVLSAVFLLQSVTLPQISQKLANFIKI